MYIYVCISSVVERNINKFSIQQKFWILINKIFKTLNSIWLLTFKFTILILKQITK